MLNERVFLSSYLLNKTLKRYPTESEMLDR